MNREDLMKTLEASRSAIVQYQKALEEAKEQKKSSKDSVKENGYDRELIESISNLQFQAAQMQCYAILPSGHKCDCCNGSGRIPPLY